jgi:hypothetical protein
MAGLDGVYVIGFLTGFVWSFSAAAAQDNTLIRP